MAHSAASHTVDPQTAAVAGPISFMASVDSKVATRSTPSGHYTPLTFRDAFIKHNLESDYVVLMNDPNLKYYRTYRVDESRNCYEYADWTFLNLPMSDLEKLGIASLKGGSMFYFSADTDKDGRDAAGVYDLNLLPIDSRLGVHSQMSKADMMASAQSSSLHAIAMCGVKTERSEASNSSDNMTAADISDEKPVYWLAENSYGPGRGWDGTIVLSADWLNTYLFRMAIDRKYVPANLQALASKRPHKLPAWHLGY